MRAFAAATGQLWKYRVCQALGAAAVLVSVAFFSLWRGNPWNLPFGLTVGLYFPICTVAFVWWAAALTCPKCSRRPVWYQMNHGGHRSFGARVAATDSCPVCGYDPSKGQLVRP
jgi:hypothetical protein